MYCLGFIIVTASPHRHIVCLDLSEKLFQVWIELWEQFDVDVGTASIAVVCLLLMNNFINARKLFMAIYYAANVYLSSHYCVPIIVCYKKKMDLMGIKKLFSKTFR